MSDGSVLWHVGHTGGFDAIPLDISPLFDNDMVFVEGKQGPGGENLTLFAMRASDGTLLWSKSLGAAPGPVIEQPQIAGGVIYVAAGTEGLDALRESDGSLLWQHTGDPVFSPFVVADGLLQVNSGEAVLAVGASNGTVVWRHSISFHDTLSSSDTPEAVDKGIVYIATTNGMVQALDASSGHMLWRYVIQELAVPTNPIYAAQVQFASTVSYQQAVRLITGLGLQTFADCSSQWRLQGGQNYFPTYHWLTVAATVNSSPLWFNRLQNTPGVVRVQADGPHSCPMMRYDPNALNLLGPDAPVTYVRATFSSNTSYDAALDAINNLGFRLANPCYEQARSRSDKPTWNAAGQENIFGSSHTLLLATTSYNATTWLSQLKSVAGVKKVDELVAATC